MSEIWSKMYIGLHVKYQLFLTDINEIWIFQTVFFFSKNTQISNLIEIRELGAELFHADKWTEGRT
jgi:hypothetical protein